MTIANDIEARFFRTLNGLTEPAVRGGFGSPCVWPTGLIVLEHTGRKTGRAYRAPVTASVIGPHVIASTVRGGRSQWLKNLAVTPETTYWLGGRQHAADVIVFASGTPAPDLRRLPGLLLPLVPGLSLLASLGMGFVILTPRPDGDGVEPRAGDSREARAAH